MEKRIGHYEIISELGRGGMGVVYKAHEQSLNRYVALKVLGEHLSEDPSYVQRFLREARSAAALNHPNIVQIYAVDEYEGQHFFAMEFVSGKSVLQMIRSKGKIEPLEAARLCLQAASGLAAAHEKDIIHRDIKPANLMVNERGLLKITDFGLALLGGGASRLTATGMFMGTPGYLSPEQCRDENIDARTDIYSLGVTLFEMLTGSIPFKADSPLALLRQILEVEPPDVRDLNPDVPDQLRLILKKMMAKDQEERYATADDLVDDLQGWLDNPEKSNVKSAPPIPEVNTLDSDATVQMPSGELRDASFNPTEAMAPPTIAPQAPPAPASPAPIQARTETTAAAEDRVAGFVSPAAAPSLNAPAPPAFSPSTPATPDSASSGRKSAIPVIIAAVLLFCALGSIAAWKTGALQKIQTRLTGNTAAPASAAAPAEAATEATETPETVSQVSKTQATTQAQEPGEPTGVAGGTAVSGNNVSTTSPGEGSGPSASNLNTHNTEKFAAGGSGSADPRISTTSGGGAGSSFINSSPDGIGGSSTSRIAQPDPGQTNPKLLRKSSPQATAQEPRAALAPVGHGVALVSVGEPLLVGATVDYVQATLSKRGLDVFDASGIPGLRRALDSGQDLNPVLRPHARWLVMITVEYLGDRQLKFMGRYETEYQARLELRAVDLGRGTPIGPSTRKVLGYTRLNVEKKVSAALRVDFRPTAKLMGEIGN